KAGVAKAGVAKAQATKAQAGKAQPADAGRRSMAAAGPHIVKVDDNGFHNKNITIKPGDTVRWIHLDRSDAVVQIANPGTEQDVCAATDGFAHEFDGNEKNEFTGPTRLGVSGIFA